MVKNLIETRDLKITIEELPNNSFIATFWDKSTSLENDRKVWKFETYGGASYHILNILKNGGSNDIL